MVPTLVNAALGGLLAAALLGPVFDRRSVALVVAAAVIPDLGGAVGGSLGMTVGAVCHTVWFPICFAGVLLVDTRWRERSLVHDRYGWRGVRVAWVALAGMTVAGIGPDLFTEPGVPLLYPVESVWYVVDGLLLYSTQEGVVQTILSGTQTPGILPLASTGASLSAMGSRPNEVVLVRTGWQAVVIATATITVAIRSARTVETAGTPKTKRGAE